MTSESILTVGVYQPEVKAEPPHDRLRRLELVLEQPAARGCDLVVCPELYMSGYFVNDQIIDCAEPSDGIFSRRVCDLARRSGCAIVYGYPERAGDDIYNAALCAGPDGDVLVNHRKNLLPHDYSGDRAIVDRAAGKALHGRVDMGSPGLKSDLTAVRLWESAAMKSEAVPRSCSFDSDTPQVEAEANDSPQNTRKQK